MFDSDFKSNSNNNNNRNRNQNININIDIDNNPRLNPMFKNSFGSLYADCVGDCGNVFAKLISKVVENDLRELPSQKLLELANDRMSIIRKYFVFHDSKMRKYLLQLMLKSPCTTSNEREFINALKDKNIKIYDRKWTLKILMILNDFKDPQYPRKLMILQKLAQKSCTRPPMMDVFEEVAENLTDMVLEPKEYYQQLEEMQVHEKHLEMIKAGEELSNNEMLAVILYTAIASVSSAFRRAHREKCISCKWRQTFTHLGSAIKKLHRVFVCGQDISKKFFSGFKPVLFHGTPLDMPTNKDHLQFRTITSLSRSEDVSCGFATKTAIGSLLRLERISKPLSNGDLIAAPVDWLSKYPEEQEWCLLPTDFLKWKFQRKNELGVKIYRISKYQSMSFIPGDDIDEYLLPVDTYLGDIPPDEKTKAVHAIFGIGVVLGTFSSLTCEHCKEKSRLVDFWGEFWTGTSSCPCCRKYVLRGVQDSYEEVECFSCGETSRKFHWKFPSELDAKREDENFYGVLCPNVECRQPHKRSLRSHKMKNLRYRANVRKEITEFMKKLAKGMFDEPMTDEEVEETCDLWVPIEFSENNADTDFIQIALNNEKPRLEHFLQVMQKSPFGLKLSKKIFEWFGDQLIPGDIKVDVGSVLGTVADTLRQTYLVPTTTDNNNNNNEIEAGGEPAAASTPEQPVNRNITSEDIKNLLNLGIGSLGKIKFK